MGRNPCPCGCKGGSWKYYHGTKLVGCDLCIPWNVVSNLTVDDLLAKDRIAQAMLQARTPKRAADMSLDELAAELEELGRPQSTELAPLAASAEPSAPPSAASAFFSQPDIGMDLDVSGWKLAPSNGSSEPPKKVHCYICARPMMDAGLARANRAQAPICHDCAWAHLAGTSEPPI